MWQYSNFRVSQESLKSDQILEDSFYKIWDLYKKNNHTKFPANRYKGFRDMTVTKILSPRKLASLWEPRFTWVWYDNQIKMITARLSNNHHHHQYINGFFADQKKNSQLFFCFFSTKKINFNMTHILNTKNQHAKFRCIRINSFRDMQAFTNLALSKIIYLFFMIYKGSCGSIAIPVNHIIMITKKIVIYK